MTLVDFTPVKKTDPMILAKPWAISCFADKLGLSIRVILLMFHQKAHLIFWCSVSFVLLETMPNQC